MQCEKYDTQDRDVEDGSDGPGAEEVNGVVVRTERMDVAVAGTDC